MSGPNYSLGFDDIYRALLTWLLHSPEQANARTGHKVRVGRGGTSFRLDLSDGILPTPGVRKVFPKSAAAEVAWYLLGSQDVSFIKKYAPMWDKFVEADGKTVAAAYGYRWGSHFGRDQLADAIATLRADPSDRRCYISAWDPSQDGLGMQNQKNVPCPLGFTLSVQDGQLHSTLTLRSSDVFVGLPYDVMGHALLMDAIATSMSLTPGIAQFSLAHAHLYDAHYEMAQECLLQQTVSPAILLPGLRCSEIYLDPEAYVARLVSVSARHEWPTYNPKPLVVA